MDLKTSKKDYKKMVEQATPNSRLIRDCIKAFAVGGTICALGELILKWLMSVGLQKEQAGMFVSIILVFCAVTLTGFGIFEKIGKFAGAGTSVPITGFANAVAAPAIEYKREGYILGVGARMFLIAGPVIVYGVAAASVIGIIYYFFGAR